MPTTRRPTAPSASSRSGDLTLGRVPAAQVSVLWPFASPFIAQALERGRVGTRLEEVEAGLRHGRAQLWLILTPNAAIVGAGATEVGTHAGRKVCTIVALCGPFGAIEFLPTIEEFAMTQGCRAMRLYGRKGWARVLPGYAERYVALEKPLRWN